MTVYEQHRSSSRKRKLPEYDPYAKNQTADALPAHAGHSPSEQMMPPPLPRLRMGYQERSQPDLNRSPLPSHAENHALNSSRPIQTFDRDTWQTINSRPDRDLERAREPYSYAYRQSGTGGYSHLPIEMSRMDIAPRSGLNGEQGVQPRYSGGNTLRSDTMETFQPRELRLMTQKPRRRGFREPLSFSHDIAHSGELNTHMPQQLPSRVSHNRARQPTSQPYAYWQNNADPTFSHRKLVDPPAASVLSPFFGSTVLSSRHAAAPPSHARSPVGQPSVYAQSIRPADNVSREPARARHSYKPSHAPHQTSLNALSFIQTPHDSSHHYRLQVPGTAQTNTFASHSRGDYHWRPPRSSANQGMTQENPPLPSESRPCALPTRSQPHRARITLPPTGSQHCKGPQDSQLSMIKGVRGSSSHLRGLYNRQSIFPANYRPRSLAPIVDNRRIIKR